MTMVKAFAQWKKQGEVVTHEEGCRCENWQAPVNECTCDCYEKAIFAAGFYMGRGVAPKTRFLNAEERADKP